MQLDSLQDMSVKVWYNSVEQGSLDASLNGKRINLTGYYIAGQNCNHPAQPVMKQSWISAMKFSIVSIVSQPSKCLKFLTFREGYFVIRN